MKFFVSIVAASAILGCASFASAQVLKREPAAGQLPHGATVLVDDGSCPKGTVKKITGGSFQLGVPRKTRCVKR